MHSLISWFARNSVAANLLMIFIIVWGLSSLAGRIPLEVFPSFELDRVTIRVPFRGGTPAEVEEAVTIKVEEAIQDIQGIKRITSTASEGLGTVNVEMLKGYDSDKLLDEVKQQVDQINDFPADAEAPSIYVPSRSREVISVIVAGDLPEKELRILASRVRDDLEALPEVSSVAVSGAREYELAIEVSEAALSRYDITLSQVAQAINNSSLDLAAGSIQTTGGEVLLRTKGQAYGSDDFRSVVVVTRPDGTRLTVGDLATVKDGFAEDELQQKFNTQRSIEIDVFRTGLQSAITVSNQVKEYIELNQVNMPYGVSLGYWRDSARSVRARLSTLSKSAVQGGLLVMLLLTLFLRFWVAVWVFVGIPVSILGGIALMPFLGVSINLLSLFAFILVLGIVVVTFGVLTTVAAFIPLLLIEGVRGKIFAQIPLIVIPVLLFSIVESKFVLPSHMSHLNFFKEKKPNVFARMQHKIADGFEWFIERVYQPVLAAALRQRYLVLSLFIGSAIVVFSIVSAGHVRFIFFPRVQSETARVSLEMVDGTPFEVTQKHIDRITDKVRELQDKHVDPSTNESIIEGIMATSGSGGRGARGSHVGRVLFELTPPEERTLDISTNQVVGELRRMIGDIPGAKNISYRAEIGRGGSPIDLEISGFDFEELQEVAALFKNELVQYPGISDISDSFEGGKQEIQLSIKPEAQQLGVSLSMLASQVRPAFLGTEVQSIQRNRDDVKVVVRYPATERQSVESLQRFVIRTPGGQELPLGSVANVKMGRGFSAIKRVDRRRTLNVEADIDKETADVEAVKADLEAYFATIKDRYPDIRVSLEGEAREQRESFGSLKSGLLFVLLVIYTLLAIPFRSYLQPLMVMCVIPFGIVGGILGHMIMGMNLSIMSYMGMLALCGVVVNDSLVLVDYVNKRRLDGVPMFKAVRVAGVARFRAVILTSLTTFFGLTPLIFESSTQAQFLIPMAVSLGFGILFATVVTLIMIPVNYLVFEDLRRLFGHKDSRFIQVLTKASETADPVSVNNNPTA